MTDSKARKYKHLTYEERREIMECLEKGMTFKAIARRNGKDPTTISKEVKKHLTRGDTQSKPTESEVTAIKNHPCPKLLKAPFVCNPCEKRRRHCTYQKQLYIAKNAHTEYEALLVEAREGIALNKEAFWEADAVITAGVKKGQRLYHIMETHDVGFSKSTAYRNLHRGYLSISKMDMPRMVKFKPRKQYVADSVPRGLREGRTYADFLAFMNEGMISSWVEMDTVLGRVGGKAILTFDFTRDNFMFGLLLDNKTADEAASKVRSLKERLKKGGARFGEIIPLLLTDNGGEFANTAAFTDDSDGDVETALFFCDPYRSCQKPKVEKNHTIFRDIVPKGESFDHFTQDTVDLIFSHVNGVKRKSLHGKSPYEMFSFLYGGAIPLLLGIREIPAADVIQSPKLLKESSEPSPGACSHADQGSGEVRHA